MDTIFWEKANSNETYFTLHNIKAAHALALGKGVKVGIIDWLFSYEKNINLYSGYVDIANNPTSLNHFGHGFWMANTLREIAPECEIFAINAVEYGDKADRIGLMEKAIGWAIKKGIDVLTYSHPAFINEDKLRLDIIIEKATKAGVITTFIHCDNPNNIWPYGCFPFNQSNMFNRTPDVNILHFDYNILQIDVYERYKSIIAAAQHVQSGDDVPFFSFSSMSPVLGGFIALMKEINRDLKTDEIRRILIETSYKITEPRQIWYDINPCGRVVDIGKAVVAI